MGKRNLLLLMFLVVCWSCQNQADVVKSTVENPIEDPIEDPTNVVPPPPTYLQGTKWKLAGIVNSKTGAVKKLTPTDCDVCYTLSFDTDYTLTAISINQRLKLDLLNFTSFPVYSGNEMLVCERYDKDGEDYCDSDYFRRGIMTTESYSATSDELRLICTYGYEYLSFTPHDGDNPATSRRGTKWKLEGMVDVETNELRKLESTNCEECYTLRFAGDYKVSARSIWAYQALDLSNLDLVLDPTRPWSWGGEQPLYAEWDDDEKNYDDSYLFRCGIAYTKTYEITPDSLKLFFVYQEKSYYLLFKLVFS